MYSPHKHSYLQSRTQGINPRIINRSVNLARVQPTIEGTDFEPPYLRLCSQQPCIPIQNIDVTRRPLAFGRWALPKLRRELHDPDADVVLAAVSSIMDLVHNPERGYEAIKLRIPDRMADVLIHYDSAIRERTCMTLTVLAGLGDGKAAIVKNKLILKNLYTLVEDDIDAVRLKAAILLEQVSFVWMFADGLVGAGFISLLLDAVLREEEEIVEIHLETLRHLLYGEGKIEALGYEGFETFVYLMDKGNAKIKSKAAACLMMITSVKPGKVLAYDTEVLTRLNMLLHSEIREIYTSAASAIMFCTINSRAKFRAKEQPDLYNRLVALTNDWHHPEVQMFCIQALSNMCEHPVVRKEVREKYLQDLEKIIVGDHEDLRRYKETLLLILTWVPWIQPP